MEIFQEAQRISNADDPKRLLGTREKLNHNATIHALELAPPEGVSVTDLVELSQALSQTPLMEL